MIAPTGRGGNSVRVDVGIDPYGSQHFVPDNAEKDVQRTAFLEAYGLRVIRIPSNEVNGNFRGVCEYIDMMVRQAMQHVCEQDI